MAISKAMIVFPLLCFLFSTISTLSHPNTLVCNETEKRALLSFKHALFDPAHRLSSWSTHEDCCGWNGVYCHNITGRVIKLDLMNSDIYNYSLEGKVTRAYRYNFSLEVKVSRAYRYNFSLGGKVSPALLQLEFLNYLDLSWNDFGGTPIPSFLGSMRSLTYLNLHGASFGGLIPPQLGNLSNLQYLSLGSGYSFYELNFTEVHWLESKSMLSSLSKLYLVACELDNMSPSLGTSHIPLNELHLSYNQLTGQTPEYIGNLSSLTSLSLNANRLNGTLPSSLWLLSNLELLYIGYNSLADTISEVHVNELSKLKHFGMSSASLIFKVKSNWVPPFQLEELWMSTSQIGPNFPTWLQTQTSLQYLDISKSGIVDIAPKWFWKWASHIDPLIKLSDNQISGNLSGVLLNNTYIDLSSNCFMGELPRLSPQVSRLNMANYSFSGPISPFLCQKLNGKSNLEILDMSTNNLAGELSHCWTYWQSLTRLNLGNNNLSGKIPDSMGSLFELEALHLHNNSLSGDIPPSLRNCTSLGLLDLGGNELSGNLPSWMGETTTLMVLRLRSNKLIGNIPPQICQLSSLIILDVANNSLSGTIPKCFNNFSLMATIGTEDDAFSSLERSSFTGYDYENLMLVIKGKESEYGSILKFVRSIDLSSNNLSGSIPTEISSLSGLEFLNLSCNNLMGSIPEKMGRMKALESLDLSRNHLSGEIPQSMKNLTFLSHLNLSYNNFLGRIPSSTQLQSFDAFSYIGNAELCGAPLTKNCTEDEDFQGIDVIDENEEGSEIPWFYIGMELGFIVGFWGVCGALLFKKAWRHAYFQFLYRVKDWVYVAIAIRLNRLQNNLREPEFMGKVSHTSPFPKPINVGFYFLENK
ncbi:Receptor-like protein 12 [Vitis vinifera]|uniref:Receptor-like protein 12 n=1 Tax=Vitis vinifera TaxID=29760 RepID=A0A438GIT7_VITVI|nr:Receptor-like protein 12 [Vitis vinifera]